VEGPREGPRRRPAAYSGSSRAGAAVGPGGAANLENRILRSEDRRDRQAIDFRIPGRGGPDVNFRRIQISEDRSGANPSCAPWRI